MTEQEIIAKLLVSDEEYKALHKEHEELKKKLIELDSKTHLNPQDEALIKRLKREKLLGKDKMYVKIEAYRKANSQ